MAEQMGEALRRIREAAASGATRLDLSLLELAAVPEEISRLVQLTSLSLSHNQLTKVPEAITRLTNLTSLSLSHNQFTKLPEAITRLTSLTELDFSQNLFTDLPEAITHLTSLTELTWTANKLTELPEVITRLTSLISLNLSYNRFTEVPEAITRLTRLTELYLWMSQFTEVPEAITRLTNLTSLDLSHGRLTKVPEAIARLTNLTSLDLSHNQLAEVPEAIVRLTGLHILDLSSNQLRIAPEILEHSNDAPRILRYLAEMRSAAPKRPLAEAKMLVVGEGGVGKTSLVKMLVDGKCERNERKTEGIDIRRWPIDVRGEAMRLNVWDFGGQEILHATHQFFLTKRSLYLLVINARQGERAGRVEYWLKIIESFGGDSPIIVVINQSEEHRLDLNPSGLQKKYPGRIKAFIETSCQKPFPREGGTKGDGLAELRAAITAAVDALEHVRDPLLMSWFSVKEELESMKENKENYIPHSRYLAMCKAHGIDNSLDHKLLIGLLHDLGIVIHYQKDRHQEDRRLQETNILNPEWVTRGIYSILNAHTLFQSKGVLAATDLDTILDPAEYPADKYDFLLGMMRKFDLCFRFEGDDDTFLVPELLPKDEPYTGDDSEEFLGFEYHYPVLPGAVISRFIVRAHQAISKKTYWRTGVLLAIGANKAVVKADLEEGRVFVTVRGPEASRRRALEVIRSHFDHIHHTIPGLNPEEKVPVPGQTCKPVDYRHLLKLEEKGIETYLPEGAEEPVAVRRLLDGIEDRDARAKRKDELREQRPAPTTALAPSPTPPVVTAPAATPPAAAKNNPWLSGSFYVFAWLVILAGLSATGMLVSPWAVPPVLIASVLGVTAIVAAQLRNDGRLEDKSFAELMTTAMKSLIFLRNDTKPGAAPALPEAAEKETPALPEASGTRRIPSPTKPAPQLPAPDAEADPKKIGTEKR